MIGGRKLWLVTLANATFPGLAVALALWYWNRPAPRLVADYWILYCAVTLLSAIAMWYVPYLFGATEEQRNLYERMYAGTRQVLPQRGEGHDVQGPLVGRGQHHVRGGAVVMRPQPVRRGHTPAVSGHQPGELVLRHRGGQVVANASLVVEKLLGDHGANGVAP